MGLSHRRFKLKLIAMWFLHHFSSLKQRYSTDHPNLHQLCFLGRSISQILFEGNHGHKKPLRNPFNNHLFLKGLILISLRLCKLCSGSKRPWEFTRIWPTTHSWSFVQKFVEGIQEIVLRMYVRCKPYRKVYYNSFGLNVVVGITSNIILHM